MRKAVLAWVVLGLLAAGPALADEKKWWGNVGFTYNEPMGEAANYIEGSGGFAAGVAFRPTGSQFGLLGEIGWSDFNAPKWQAETDVTGELVELSGHIEIWSLTLNGVWRAPTDGRFGFYVVGGLGAYRRDVSIKAPAEYEYVVWCDPWWGYCYVEGVPVSGDVLASASTTAIGYNLGLGATWKLNFGAEIYVEARYTLVDTPQETEYVPIAVGIRF